MESTACLVAVFSCGFPPPKKGQKLSGSRGDCVPKVLRTFPVPALEIKKYLDNHLPCGVE